MNRFGIREICDVVFKPLTSVDIGNQHFDAYQPVLYIDTAKTSSLEGAATTVYAQGGQGNPRLIGWDGEKTLTFTLEDALMSPISFSILSGAGVVKGRDADAGKGIDAQKVYVHTNYDMVAEKVGEQIVAKLSDEDRNGATLVVSKEAPVYPITLDSAGAQAEYLSAVTDQQVMILGEDGASLEAAEINNVGEVQADGKTICFVIGSDDPGDPRQDEPVKVGDTVRIDCYEVHTEGAYEMQIDAETFAGYYYIEASTLFRDEETGSDLPAEFVIPRGKIQSNFTFTMANSGDPSTFTFTIDCFPAYTKFNRKKKVMAILQVLDNDAATHNYRTKSVMGHENRTSDDDVDKWYSKSIFNAEGEDDENGFFKGAAEGTELVNDANKTMALDEATYAAVEGGETTWGGKSPNELGTFKMKASETTPLTYEVTGTVNNIPEWSEAWSGASATGYYIPLRFAGEEGQVICMADLDGNLKDHKFTDNTTEQNAAYGYGQTLILSFKKGADGRLENRTFTIYPATEQKQTTGPAATHIHTSEGTVYTIDVSGVTVA